MQGAAALIRPRDKEGDRKETRPSSSEGRKRRPQGCRGIDPSDMVVRKATARRPAPVHQGGGKGDREETRPSSSGGRKRRPQGCRGIDPSEGRERRPQGSPPFPTPPPPLL